MSYISFNIGGIVELYFLRKMVFALFARPSYGERALPDRRRRCSALFFVPFQL